MALAARRGSFHSATGSAGSGGAIVPAVKIPAPVDYSETVRIHSSADPDSGSHVESDSVQTFSKKTIPFEDGFSSQTMESSEKTTVTRSEYLESPSHSSGADIRSQESGGVVIQVRSNQDEP